MTTPRWATAVRKARLVLLWHRYGNRCLQGHRTCPDPSHYLLVDGSGRTHLLRLYDVKSEGAIRYWVSDDAAQRMAEWKAEQARLHRAPDQHFHQGEFDNIRREKFLAEQPPYYIEALTPDALTFRPVALVRIPSTGVHLFVELGEALQRISKRARRRAVRQGQPLPPDTAAAVDKLIQSAVQDWWAKRK
jgi:hypothetical protein